MEFKWETRPVLIWHDRRTFTSVIEIAIEDYLKGWEKKNGAVTPALLEKAKII